MYKKNIVVFTKYQNLSASVRHRFYAFNEILTKNNFEITYFPLFNDDFFKKKIFRNKINYFQLLLTYIKRFIQIFFYKKPFLAIIHFELFPYLPVIGEKILLFRNVPIIIDFDDAIFHQYENRNYILDKFYKRKFKKLFSLSYSVFAGNKYNKECAIQFGSKNVEYIPTVIDLEKYTKNSYNKLPNFTLVWIGSPSTAIYIKQILPILIKIQKLGVDIRLIGAGNINLPGLKFDLIELI